MLNLTPAYLMIAKKKKSLKIKYLKIILKANYSTPFPK